MLDDLFNWNNKWCIEVSTPGLDNKNSSEYDDIPNKLFKSIIDEVCTPLTVIINKSLWNWIFPDALKIAIVKPLFKNGEKNFFNNYRPISLLSTILKNEVLFIFSHPITLIKNNLLVSSFYRVSNNKTNWQHNVLLRWQ